MRPLNNRFDTSKDFPKALVDECGDTIPDYQFEQACGEFEIDEDEAMQMMVDSTDYEFERLGDGWVLFDNTDNDGGDDG